MKYHLIIEFIKVFLFQLSECKVAKEILKTTKNINCKYRDILYENDAKYTIGPPTSVLNDGVYTLRKSDHVKVTCVGKHMDL